jgi:hypothetical protein
VLDVAGLGYALSRRRCAELGVPLTTGTIAECIVRACGAMAILAAQEPRAAILVGRRRWRAIACLESGNGLARGARDRRILPLWFAAAPDVRSPTRLRLGACARGPRAKDGATRRRVSRRRDAWVTVPLRRFRRPLPGSGGRRPRVLELATTTNAAQPARSDCAASCLLQRDGCLVDGSSFESPRGATLSARVGIDARRTLCAADTIVPTPAPTAGERRSVRADVNPRCRWTPTRAPTPRRTAARAYPDPSSPTPAITPTPAVVQAARDRCGRKHPRAGTNGGIFESYGGDSWTPSAPVSTLDARS